MVEVGEWVSEVGDRVRQTLCVVVVLGIVENKLLRVLVDVICKVHFLVLGQVGVQAVVCLDESLLIGKIFGDICLQLFEERIGFLDVDLEF